MNKFKALILVMFFMLVGLSPAVALAQVDTATKLQAVVSARDSVPAGKNIIFNAEKSYNPTPERPVLYVWNFGDGNRSSGEEVAHVFQKPGVYKVMLSMQVGGEKSKVKFPVFAYNQVTLLISDNLENETTIAALTEAARKQDNLLAVARSFDTATGFLAKEGAITVALESQPEALQATSTVILWVSGSNGLGGLMQFAQEYSPAVDFGQKQIVVITDDSLAALMRIARSVFSTLQPKNILLTRVDALRNIVLNGVTNDTPTQLADQAIPYRNVDSGVEDFSIFAPLSFFVNYLMVQGIPASVILLVLMLPVIATIVAFLKQVVGITTFGVYTPSIVTLSFLMIGLKLGLATLVIVVVVSVLIRRLLRRYRLSYTPRMAIVLSGVALAVLAMIVLLIYAKPFGERVVASDLIATSIFPMLIMSTLAERFVSIQTEKGASSAIRLLGEVTFTAVICYLIVGEWGYFRTLMLAHPEIIFIFLAGNVILGRYTGLRITEYFRFKDVIRKAEEE